nr:reverse transcriptase domain-containing protein [Tanacetum cinerariifolium]
MITNPKEDLKGITTRSGTAYQGPTIPTSSSSFPPVVERETEVTKDTVPHTNNGSTKDVQPPGMDECLAFADLDASINLMPLSVWIKLLLPELSPTCMTLELADRSISHKLSELARTPLNEHCSAVLLKKLPEKLGDPSKFLIPCDFTGMAECLALADLGASINLMPLSVWNKLSLPDLSPTCMTLELADRSISRLVGVAEDVFVKVGTFYFPSDFVVVDFDADPRVPLILERSFLKTGRALIDVFEGELTLLERETEATKDTVHPTNNGSTKDVQPLVFPTKSPIDPVVAPIIEPVVALVSDPKPNQRPSILALIDVFKGELTVRVGKEAITFNLGQTSRYSANYNDMTANRIDVIDMDCEEYSQEVLGFFDVIVSGNPTPYYDPIVSTTSPTLTSFRNSDFLLEEVDAFLALEDDPNSPEVDQSYVNTEGDILLLEAFLNDDPLLLPPNQRNYLPQNEVLKLLDAGLIYPISDSPWVSLVHYVPKKGDFTIVENEENELLPTRLVTGWRVCIEYQNLNEATRKDHFPLPFMDQMLERLARNEYYCFLDGFSVFENSFQTYLSHLERMLKRCEDTNLCLNWEKSHFMVKEGIVLSHKISKNMIEVDKAKVDVIAKLPYPTTIKAEKEMLAVVYAFEKFQSYLIMNKSIMYPDHSALKYLFAKKDSKARLLCWVLLLQEFTFKVIDTKGAENLAADHIS